MIEQIQPILIMMLSNMKNETNNYFTQCLIFLILFIPIISKKITFDNITDFLNKILFKNDNCTSIYISSHEVPIIRGFAQSPITKLVYSKDFLSIIHYLTENKITNLMSLTEIMTSNTELNICYDENDRNKDNTFIYIPIHNKILLPEKDEIYFEINDANNKVENENDNDKKSVNMKKKKFVIVLSINKVNNVNNLHSKVDKIDILKNFIHKCRENYDIFHKKTKDDNKQYIFEYKNCERTESSLVLKYKQYLMEHNKDLSVNIFFEEKDKLINYIHPFIYDKFEKNNLGEEKYKRSGFTFKAGILFYGSPGCGKTSTIKAILKYTNRHGIIINLNRVKTCEELELIFRNRSINERDLNGKQLCYILEDCDAFNDDIIKSRKKEDEDSKKHHDISEVTQFMEMNTCNIKNIIKKEEDSVNLSCFLNILDGIIELHGVMIIMTTNHPEKIDEALIRPGRFDFKYEFKKASKKIVKEMIQFKFDLTNEEMDKCTEHMNIKDEMLSPAEVQSICFQNNDVKKCIDEIIFASQR